MRFGHAQILSTENALAQFAIVGFAGDAGQHHPMLVEIDSDSEVQPQGRRLGAARTPVLDCAGFDLVVSRQRHMRRDQSPLDRIEFGALRIDRASLLLGNEETQLAAKRRHR